MEHERQPVCLTIAGLDPSGGAGILADIRTFAAFGCFPTAAVASITFQNTMAVFGAEHQSAETVRGQVQPVIDDLGVDAVKTGMLPTKAVIAETSRLITENDLSPVVVDPVVRSTSGFDLIDHSALRSLIDDLFPLAAIVTPNVPETERITGVAIEDEDDIAAAARIMQGFGASNVLVKGGHLNSAGGKAVDHLFIGEVLHKLEAPFIETQATHGTGCALAAAIAANLALGKDLLDAVRTAKSFVHHAIATAERIGKGNSPINIPTTWQQGKT